MRFGRMAAACLVAAALVGCASLDDIARQVAQRAGRAAPVADDVATRLRAWSATEDDAIRLGQEVLESSAGVSAAEGRVGSWIDDALGSLAPEHRAQVRGVALSATCDALDSAAQGQLPDLGSMVVSGLGSMSDNIDQQLLRTQLTQMWDDFQAGNGDTFAARAEILTACILADL